MGEVIPFPNTELTPNQTIFFEDRLAYWEEQIEIALRQHEYADRQKEISLRMLGRLGVEKGLEG